MNNANTTANGHLQTANNPIFLGNGVRLDLVQIPAGSFLMGSPPGELPYFEGPQHKVTLKGFEMSVTPITQAQWRSVARMPMLGLMLPSDPSTLNGDNRPVETVNWFEAMEFCQRLSRYTGETFTLPSEAQWEYACRAGSITAFTFGDTLTPRSAIFGVSSTTMVGRFPANAWGLKDMHGNVWEWCLDHWHDNYDGAPEDGSAWLNEKASENAMRLQRGGCWNDFLARHCHSAYRLRLHPAHASHGIGFRVCCLPQ